MLPWVSFQPRHFILATLLAFFKRWPQLRAGSLCVCVLRAQCLTCHPGVWWMSTKTVNMNVKVRGRGGRGRQGKEGIHLCSGLCISPGAGKSGGRSGGRPLPPSTRAQAFTAWLYCFVQTGRKFQNIRHTLLKCKDKNTFQTSKS